MTTIALKQAASCSASGIHLMTAQPMNDNLINLAGGTIQFTRDNPLADIANATFVDITYDAAHGGRHETLAVSSVMV